MTDRALRDLTGLRLAAQSIAASSFTSPADVVRWMLAMQAQDYPGARWSVGLRLPASTDAMVEAAIASGSIARSWPFRGTLHLVAPEDLGWILPIAAERQAAAAAKRRADLGITEADLDRATGIAHDLMVGGRAVRRDRLLEAWHRDGVSTEGQRGYHLLWNLGHRGVLVFGPAEGKQPSFALYAERVPNPRILERDAALAELALRYFRSHGPATVNDLAWWASITLGDARSGLGAVREQLERREFGGVEYWMAQGLEPAKPGVHVLPGFDEYLLGYRDRSAPLPAEHADRIVPGNNGVFLPTIVVDGRVVGTWRRTETAKAARIELTGFAPLTTRAREGARRGIRRYGRFLGKPIDVLD